jgi:hypothetical protein
VQPATIKALFGLAYRLSGKSIELDVEAIGKTLKV